MVRQHPGAPAAVTCVWPATPDIADDIGQRLICWAGPENVAVRTIPSFHYEVPKALCGTNGPLRFTPNGMDQCPIGDDLTVSAADPIDTNTCEDGQLIEGNLILEGTLFVNQPDASTRGIVITQNNPVTSTDANMMELIYLGFNTSRNNEIGLPRHLTPPLSTGLGKEGETTFQAHAGTATSKNARLINSNGTETIFTRGDGTNSFTAPITAPNTTKGTPATINIDSPTAPGRYTAGAITPTAVVDDGNMGRLSGNITISVASVAGDVMASVMPAAIPSVDRTVLAGVAGAAAQIRISSAGVLTIQRSAQIGTLSLDGITYPL
jgi:hypothetical protein